MKGFFYREDCSAKPGKINWSWKYFLNRSAGIVLMLKIMLCSGEYLLEKLWATEGALRILELFFSCGI